MKTKILSLTLTLTLAAFGFSACGRDVTPDTSTTPPVYTEASAPQETGTTAPSTTADAARTLDYYAGIYGADRCTVRIEPLNAEEAKIRITWGSSAWESSVWEMTAVFDPNTYTLTYTDCVMADLVYDDDGNETRTVRYENGKGSFRLQPDHSMQWLDAQEDAGADMEFSYSPLPQ